MTRLPSCAGSPHSVCGAPSRFFISAAHKSSGKTTVSIGLCAALAARSLHVQAFKKGPDYIDPMWLGAASGHPCRNLDLHLMSGEEIDRVYGRFAATADVTLVEGNKGLYDGVELDGRDSNAALASRLGLPVVLVIDTRGMTRGIAPLLLGYQRFDPQVHIAGVILNLVGGPRHESKMRAVIEHYTDLLVLGSVARSGDIAITERHLGLIPSNEIGDVASRIAAIRDHVVRCVDLDRLLDATRATAPVAVSGEALRRVAQSGASVRIGVAIDAAFGFYYPDDLEALCDAGAELVPVDLLHDRHLPDVHGLFIGGGFPESFAAAIEANASLRTAVRTRVEAGMPVYAECGGLMYLARSLTWHGQTHRMAGVIPGDVVMHERPVGRGYVRLAPTADHPWFDTKPLPAAIPGHEFHHSSLENLPAETRYAYQVQRGHGVDGTRDGVVIANVLASYAHLRHLRASPWAEHFVDFVRRCRSVAGPWRAGSGDASATVDRPRSEALDAATG